jgi:hypothetical protein
MANPSQFTPLIRDRAEKLTPKEHRKIEKRAAKKKIEEEVRKKMFIKNKRK